MDLHDWRVYAAFVLIMSLILLLVGNLAAGRRARIPGRLQGFFELTTEYLRETFLGALGPGGEKHLPLAFALFWYILFCNLLELIPGFIAPTANPSNTIGLGIIVFVYVQYVGIKSKGLVGYLKHFAGPMLLLTPLFIPIELMGELIKPFSLGMRLFGNIYAEDIINDMTAKAIPFVPFQLIVYPLQIFTGTIQAFIFPLLTCAYIGLMTETHDDHGDEYNSGPHSETMEEKLAGSIGTIGAHVQS